jgi:hypothetical protein
VLKLVIYILAVQTLNSDDVQEEERNVEGEDNGE